MPGPAPQVTERDRAVLREIARLAAAPPAAVTHLFPSRAAAYVRLGVLADRGLIGRVTSFGKPAYVVTPRGAAASGAGPTRAAMGSAARAARLAAVAAMLVPIGYEPAPPRPGVPRGVSWFRHGKRVVAVYPSAARLTIRRARGILGRLWIHRHAAHAVILAGSSRTTPRLVRIPIYPPAAVVPVPLRGTARLLVAGLV